MEILRTITQSIKTAAKEMQGAVRNRISDSTRRNVNRTLSLQQLEDRTMMSLGNLSSILQKSGVSSSVLDAVSAAQVQVETAKLTAPSKSEQEVYTVEKLPEDQQITVAPAPAPALDPAAVDEVMSESPQPQHPAEMQQPPEVQTVSVIRSDTLAFESKVPSYNETLKATTVAIALEHLGGQAVVASWKGRAPSQPSIAFDAKNESAVLSAGGAMSVDLSGSGGLVKNVSAKIDSGAAGDIVSVKVFRELQMVGQGSVPAGEYFTFTDEAGITSVIIDQNEVELSQVAQEFLYNPFAEDHGRQPVGEGARP